MAMRAKDLTTPYLAIRKIIINVGLQRLIVHTFPAHFGIGELHNTAILTTLQQFSQNFTIDAAPVVQLIVVVVLRFLWMRNYPDLTSWLPERGLHLLVFVVNTAAHCSTTYFLSKPF